MITLKKDEEHKNKDKRYITVTYSSTNEKTLNEVIAALIIIHKDKKGGARA